ncbi:MAG: O-antigen polysaccharide polymerase Wzy family protein [Muribaculum sp.]|nr:O-antigen polysaccharide polymerase Wzy family protein [Muribaculum sp.]
MDNNSYKKIHIIFIGLLLTGLYSIYYLHVENFTYSTLRILGIFSTIQLVYIFFSWHRLSGNFYDAYLLFMTACYAFNLGQPVLEVFEAVDPTRSILVHYHHNIITYNKATFISMLFLMGFHFGAIIAYKHQQIHEEEFDNTNYRFYLYAISKVATVIAVLSFPGYIYNTIINMMISATYGYSAIYQEGTGRIKIFQLIGEYYAPAMLCMYFVSMALHRHTKCILCIILLTLFVPPLFIGGRSNAMIIVALMVLIYMFFHKIHWKQLLAICTIGYIMMIVFAAIAGNRSAGSRNFETYLENKSQEVNPAIHTLTEMGGSIQPLIHCLNIIPEYQDFKYGESYLYAMTTIIPNIGFWDVHPATKHSNLGNWLKNYLHLNYGPGFSIVAEAYYNFGYYGFLMMLILGALLTNYFGDVNKTTLYRNPIKFIMAIVLLWLTIKMVRNSFEFAVRAVVYYYLPMYWLMKYSYNNILNKERRHFKPVVK